MTNDRRKMAPMRAWVAQAQRGLSAICDLTFQILREVSGEAACERYRRAASDEEAPGRFYLRYLEEKYSRPCRCC